MSNFGPGSITIRGMPVCFCQHFDMYHSFSIMVRGEYDVGNEAQWPVFYALMGLCDLLSTLDLGDADSEQFGHAVPIVMTSCISVSI